MLDIIDELGIVRRIFPEAELLFSAGIIARHVSKVAEAIAAERHSQNGGHQFKVIVVLDGAMPYAVDLVRQLAAFGVSDLAIDSIQLSRYGAETEPTKIPKIIKDLRYPITDQDVLVVDDILDGGLTLRYLREQILLPRAPASLKITTLTERMAAQLAGTPRSDYPTLAFQDDGRFAMGYGLDMRQGQARHFASIYLVPKPG